MARLPPVLPFICDGRLRTLGTGVLEPSPATPDIPPPSGAGLPDFEASSFAALYGPAGLLEPVIVQLHAAAVAALRDNVVAERPSGLAYNVVASSPEELLTVQRAETVRWGDIIRQASIRPESG